MTRLSTILILAVALFPSTLFAQKSLRSDTIFRAMGDELQRTVNRLEMEKLGKPYFVAFTVEDRRRLSIEASFGALKKHDARRSREMKINLRVGKPQFDNSNYSPSSFCLPYPQMVDLDIDDNYDALRFSMWTAVDEAYRSALEALSQKKAYVQKKMIKNALPDLSKEKAETSVVPLSDLPFDQRLWEDRARQISAVFRRYPAIQSSQVAVRWMEQYTYFMDSEGRKILKPTHDYEIYMEASTQAPDGMVLRDQRQIIRKSLGQLPSFASLENEAVGLAEELSALVRAPLWDESYVGPVLLEGVAAGEFFNQLLAYNVSFPREVLIGNEDATKSFRTGAFTGHLGIRSISPILNVEDDPTRESFEGIPLLGAYAFDDEGIPAQRVSLIEKGILKDVLMSRAPIKNRSRSNGHGRGTLREQASGRIGNLIVTSEKTASQEELKKALLRQAKELGLQYGVLVRRIEEETRSLDDEGAFPPPLIVYKVYVKDGREELVRNAQFTGITLRALRDVILTSRDQNVYNFYQLGRDICGSDQLQASLVHPSVLIEEMELKKSDKKPDKLPYLKHPHFER